MGCPHFRYYKAYTVHWECPYYRGFGCIRLTGCPHFRYYKAYIGSDLITGGSSFHGVVLDSWIKPYLLIPLKHRADSSGPE